MGHWLRTFGDPVKVLDMFAKGSIENEIESDFTPPRCMVWLPMIEISGSKHANAGRQEHQRCQGVYEIPQGSRTLNVKWI